MNKLIKENKKQEKEQSVASTLHGDAISICNFAPQKTKTFFLLPLPYFPKEAFSVNSVKILLSRFTYT